MGLRGVKLAVCRCARGYQGSRVEGALRRLAEVPSSTSCVTPWPMPERADGVSCPPSSQRPLPMTLPKLQAPVAQCRRPDQVEGVENVQYHR